MNKLFFGLIIISFFGCKTYYVTGTKHFKSTNELIDYSTKLNINLPVNIKLNGVIKFHNKTYNIGGSIKIESDDRYQIFVNSTALGIEIIRIDFNGDSVTFIDRINKKYFRGNTANLLKIDTNINLLNIISGRCFDGFVYNKIDTNNYKYANSNISGNIFFNNFGYVQSNIISINKKNKISVNYNNFSKKYSLPNNIMGFFLLNGNMYDFDINYQSISKLKAPLKNFRKPKSYKVG